MIIIHISDQKGLVQICMNAILKDSNIQVNYIPILQRAAIWNAVTNYFVGGDANTFRKIVIFYLEKFEIKPETASS